MASHNYTAGDLLRMRGQSVGGNYSEGLRNRLHSNPELGTSKMLRRSVSDKSSDFIQDEIVRAPYGRRLARIPETARLLSEASDDKPMAQQFAARQLDGNESELNYRGRSESDDVQPQPVRPPPDLNAQKSEGFQRFYRAVVSPTHVRVTAGGRIVPNNRGTSSPTTKWEKDKPLVDEAPANQPLNRIQLPPQSGFAYPAQFTYSGYPMMYPGLVPGINHAMPHPPHTLPVVPWHMGAGMGGAMPMPMAPESRAHGGPLGHTSSKDSSQTDRRSESGIADKPHAAPAYRPEAFDPSRAPPYPGHYMMHPGGPIYAVGMAPPHAFPPSVQTGPTVLTQGMPATHPGYSGAVTPKQSEENEAPAGSTPASLTAPTMPPVTSIRPSDITTKHLEILRSRVKYLEDQLQYNKHQIDERWFRSETLMTRDDIKAFEKNLEQQLRMEEIYYPPRKAPPKPVEPKPTFKGAYYGPNANYKGVFSDDNDRVIEKPQYWNKPPKKGSLRSKNGTNSSAKSCSVFKG